MDIVIPFKRRTDESELRYSLRSACANLKFDQVVIVGDRPRTVKLDIHIRHIGPTSRYDNTCSKLLEAARSPEVSEEFVLMNDDFFILKPMREVAYLYSKTMAEWLADYAHPRDREYYKLALRTRELVGDDGRFYSLHCPMVMEKSKLLELAARYRLPRSVMLRTLYGCHYATRPRQSEDHKARNGEEVAKFARTDWFSTSNGAARTREFQETMRRLFPEPSRFEKAV